MTAPPEATLNMASVERGGDAFHEAIERLRLLPLEGSQDDQLVARELIDWLEAVDMTSLAAETTQSLLTFADLFDGACALEAANAPESAVAFAWRCTLMMLAVANERHERDTVLVERTPTVSLAELRRDHIAPLHAEARRVQRTLRRWRVSRTRVPRSRGCGHQRAPRRAARRAAGIRSGTDPGDDSPGESPRRRRQPRHVSHALAALLERIEVAS
jgi:hypothetical protein